jgi:IPT/TIG domain
MSLRIGLAAVLLVCVFLFPAVAARDPQPTPLMRTVEPASAKAGDTVTVTGDNLTKDVVVEVYLTDRKDKTKVAVVEQTNTTVKFKVPAQLKAGKYWLMVLANLSEPLFIEEPAFLNVE